MAGERKARLRFRRKLVRQILLEDPTANPRTIHSDLGWCLNRWAESRVARAVQDAQGANAMGQVVASLIRQPKVLHVKKRAA